MVSLSSIRSSNSLISSILSPGLVAVFVGGTSGIGEETLKKFAEHTIRPRAYIVGRSQTAADRIVAECQAINPEGQYIFHKADVSLIRGVDEICEEIKAREQAVNILFLTCGVLDLNRSKTADDLHLLAALNYYARIRFITNLLPLIQRASALRRVVTVGGGGHESGLDTSDFQALRVSSTPEQLRGHLTSLVTLGLEAVAQAAPDVSFIHDFPGSVRTKIVEGLPEEILRTLEWVPVEESGQRHLYLATSARYPPANVEDACAGVPVGDEVEVMVGTTGMAGSGVYSVGVDCEAASPAVLEILRNMRERGLVQEVRLHTEGEFRRITGKE
ncbi:NAD(P)-binding protein [Xylaria curta]|nr:NAD(P)-binding protein [Xylaria curta]